MEVSFFQNQNNIPIIFSSQFDVFYWLCGVVYFVEMLNTFSFHDFFKPKKKFFSIKYFLAKNKCNSKAASTLQLYPFERTNVNNNGLFFLLPLLFIRSLLI